MQRQGFTLKEVIVLIVIIGGLGLLCLKGIQQSHEGSRRRQCKNNLRNIALATLAYESNKGEFPCWRNTLYVTTDEDGNESPFDVSWAGAILTELELGQIHDQWADPTVLADEKIGIYLPLFVCPNVCRIEGPKDFPLTYAANCGLLNDNSKRSGVFLDGREPHRTSLETLTSLDGSSNTVMFVENSNAWKWMWYGPDGLTCPHQNGLGANWVDPITDYSDCDATVASGRVTPPFAPSECLKEEPQASAFKPGVSDGLDYRFSRPASLHPGGFNVAMADGSCLSVDNDVDPEVYNYVMNPADATMWNGLGWFN